MDKVQSTASFTVRTFGVSWPMLVWALTLVTLLTNADAGSVLSDPDTYWHLAAGRWIVDHGAIPKGDPFSYSMPGAEWTAHEWLSEIVMFGVQSLAGWTGLVALVALLFAATLALLMRFLQARLEPVHALLFVAFACVMLLGHLLVRPHVFAWPLFVMWTGALLGASETRRSPPWWLLGVMAFWANLHGSFTLGLAVGGALGLDAVLNHEPGRRLIAAKSWALFFLLSVGAAMATPAGWKGLWYTAHVMSLSYGLDVIQEWRSPDFHRPQMLEIWLMLALSAAFSGRVRLPWLRLLLVLSLVHLALKYQRYVSMLALISPLLVAKPLAAHWATREKSGKDVVVLDRAFRAFAAAASAKALAAAALTTVLVVGLTLGRGQFFPSAARTPAAAVDAGLRAQPPGPVLTAYDFGGYLIYRSVRVFVDGRSEMYGDEFLKRYVEAITLQKPADAEKLLAQFQVGWTIFEPGAPIVTLMDKLPGWHRVYTDGIAIVHVRETPPAPPATP